MQEDQGWEEEHASGDEGGCSCTSARALERLLGTVISRVDFFENQSLQIKGSDADGQARWALTVSGSARFTFSHKGDGDGWLVESNFDPGGTVRRSDRTMIEAICGARLKSISLDEDALFLRSGDGRAIEIPYVLNEEGIVLDILPDEAFPAPCRIVLPFDLEHEGLPGSLS